MESTEPRRQSDVLPSINYPQFDRVVREGAQFHQRNQSLAGRPSISAASPISPTTMFGPATDPRAPSYPPPPSHSGIHTPPESRRTSGNDEQPRQQPQTLPSLHEVFESKPPSSYSAPSPMHTPPIGSGSFSGPSRHNSMPRSQPSESAHSSQSAPLGHPPHAYPPVSQPPPSNHHVPEPSYTRHDSHSTSRTLPPNPYSQTQPTPSIPPMQPPESYHPPPHSATHPHPRSPPYRPHSQSFSAPAPPPPPPRHSPPHHFGQPGPPSSFGCSQPTPPPPPPSQYPPYPHHQQSTPAPPPPSTPYQNPPPPAGYPYPPRDSGYPPHDVPHHSPAPKAGVKRGSGGYGSVIERALSISATKRDLNSAKEGLGRAYHIIQTHEDAAPSRHISPQESLQMIVEALRTVDIARDYLLSSQQMYTEIAAKDYEQSNQKPEPTHSSEYGGPEDNQPYCGDDRQSNGSQQPEQKKVRRGRAAPPGRCHSCHRAETPEWRRGPDGARTLCNACGLHYAKLTRKLSKNSIGSGPLAGRKPPNSPLT